MPRVGFAIEEFITSELLWAEDVVAKHVSARMLKLRIIFTHRVAATFIVGYALAETSATSEKTKLWKTRGSSIPELPTNEPDTHYGCQRPHRKER